MQDIQRCSVPSNSPLSCLEMGRFKSDIFAEKKLVKYLHTPHAQLQMAVTQQVSYGSLYQALRNSVPHLTPHSFRRGACTRLANLGFSPETIAQLTLHSDGLQGSVRRYIETAPQQAQPHLQLELSRLLWEEIPKGM